MNRIVRVKTGKDNIIAVRYSLEIHKFLSSVILDSVSRYYELELGHTYQVIPRILEFYEQENKIVHSAPVCVRIRSVRVLQWIITDLLRLLPKVIWNSLQGYFVIG